MVNPTDQQRRVKRILVTGASGLIGSPLCRRWLDAGIQIIALFRHWHTRSVLIDSGDIHRCTVVQGDIVRPGVVAEAINQYCPDTVVHLAAQTQVGPAYRAPLRTLESNIRGSWQVLEACREHRSIVQRLVMASSDKAYGEAETLPYQESTPLQGRYPYDVSKSCADLLAQSYWHSYRLPVVVTRCGNVYGGGDLHFDRLIPGTIAGLLAGERPVIRSDGTFVRDYIYIDDVVEAYDRLIHAVGIEGMCFNIAPRQPRTVLEVVELIGQVVGRSDLAPAIQNTACGEIRRQYLDAGLAHSQLGWQPQWSMPEALVPTVAWYRQWLSGSACR